MRIGQSVGGLPFTTLRGQIKKYAGILQQAKADNNGRLEVECLKEISRKLSFTSGTILHGLS